MTEEARIKHESFGFIRASRVSGNASLFDSAIHHQHYIVVEIGNAEQIRRHGETHVHGGIRGIISVAMSESQFAQFITSMNVGSGAPCTLQYVAGKRMSEPPTDINTRETFEVEVKEKAEEIHQDLHRAIASLQSLLDKGKANKGDMQSVMANLQRAQQQLLSNMPFLMRQFAEGIEKLTDRAKADLNAHAVMLGQRLVVRDETPQAIEDGAACRHTAAAIRAQGDK